MSTDERNATPGVGDPVAEMLRGQPEHEIGPLRYHMVPRPGYLLVHYSGQVATVEIAERWFESLDASLERYMMSRILWDSRPALPHPAPVRARIWEWLEEARVLQRSAILVKSEMLRLSANLSGLNGSLSLQAFRTFEEAERWLQD